MVQLTDLPEIKRYDAQGYEIALCSYPGHNTYWLAGGCRWQHVPPVKAGIWRCCCCCPPLPWVTETKEIDELIQITPPVTELLVEVL